MGEQVLLSQQSYKLKFSLKVCNEYEYEIYMKLLSCDPDQTCVKLSTLFIFSLPATIVRYTICLFYLVCPFRTSKTGYARVTHHPPLSAKELLFVIFLPCSIHLLCHLSNMLWVKCALFYCLTAEMFDYLYITHTPRVFALIIIQRQWLLVPLRSAILWLTAHNSINQCKEDDQKML